MACGQTGGMAGSADTLEPMALVLVVEDEPEIAEILEAICAGRGSAPSGPPMAGRL